MSWKQFSFIRSGNSKFTCRKDVSQNQPHKIFDWHKNLLEKKVVRSLTCFREKVISTNDENGINYFKNISMPYKILCKYMTNTYSDGWMTQRILIKFRNWIPKQILKCKHIYITYLSFHIFITLFFKRIKWLKIISTSNPMFGRAIWDKLPEFVFENFQKSRGWSISQIVERNIWLLVNHTNLTNTLY